MDILYYIFTLLCKSIIFVQRYCTCWQISSNEGKKAAGNKQQATGRPAKKKGSRQQATGRQAKKLSESRFSGLQD
jgi:hypothetical protein